MQRCTFLLAALPALLPAPTALGQQAFILFTPRRVERVHSNTGPEHMRWISPRDVAAVFPARPFRLPVPPFNWVWPPYSASKLFPAAAWDTLAGDVDGDGIYGEPWHEGQVDALMVGSPAPGFVYRRSASKPTAQEVYFSLSRRAESLVSGQTILPGDVVRLLPKGRFDVFLSEAQLRGALGFSGGRVPSFQPADLDAIAYVPGPTGMILFSLEDDVLIDSGRYDPPTVFVPDGSILAIPLGNVRGWTPTGGVGTVDSRCVQVVLLESAVDALVQHAAIRDYWGRPVTAIGDLDALEVDPNGGTFAAHNNTTLPNLWFAGEKLAGAAVLSTRDLGSPAVYNQRELASTTFSDGRGVGLEPSGSDVELQTCESLDGLALFDGTGTPVLDTPKADPVLPATLELDLLGPGSGSGLLLWGGGPTQPRDVLTLLPAPPFVTSGFPDFDPGALVIGIGVTFDASGYRQIRIPLPREMRGATLSWLVLSPGLPLGPALSNPLVVQLR